MIPILRAVFTLAAVTIVTLVLIPVQSLAIRFDRPLARTLPVRFHRFVLKRIGVRVRTYGQPSAQRPLLLTPNHVSWLDIPVLSALAPISFVAKSEVATWPIIRTFARLQRSVYIDRKRRHDTGRVTGEVAERLAGGDVIVMFLEGTSSDGSRVLPFRSALLGAARQVLAAGASDEVTVQPVAIAYTRLQGLPIGRSQRPFIAWIGDMEMGGHLWNVLKEGAVDVDVWFGELRTFAAGTDRKLLAAELEAEVRAAVIAFNFGRPLAPAGAPASFPGPAPMPLPQPPPEALAGSPVQGG